MIEDRARTIFVRGAVLFLLAKYSHIKGLARFVALAIMHFTALKSTLLSILQGRT